MQEVAKKGVGFGLGGKFRGEELELLIFGGNDCGGREGGNGGLVRKIKGESRGRLESNLEPPNIFLLSVGHHTPACVALV